MGRRCLRLHCSPRHCRCVCLPVPCPQVAGLRLMPRHQRSRRGHGRYVCRLCASGGLPGGPWWHAWHLLARGVQCALSCAPGTAHTLHTHTHARAVARGRSCLGASLLTALVLYMCCGWLCMAPDYVGGMLYGCNSGEGGTECKMNRGKGCTNKR